MSTNASDLLDIFSKPEPITTVQVGSGWRNIAIESTGSNIASPYIPNFDCFVAPYFKKNALVATFPSVRVLKRDYAVTSVLCEYANDLNVTHSVDAYSHNVAELIAVIRSVFIAPEFSVADYVDLEEGWKRKVLVVTCREDEEARDIAEDRFYAAVEDSAILKEALSLIIVSFTTRCAT